MTTMSVKEITQVFRLNVSKHYGFVVPDSVRSAAFDSFDAAYKTLAATEEGRASILSLFSDPNRLVRYEAAGRSLDLDPEGAVCALEALLSDPESEAIVLICAETSLSEHLKKKKR